MGYNGFGQLGNGTTNDVFRPVNIASNVVSLAGGGYHTLFTTADGMLWAMGNNQFGQFGNGTTNNASQPVSVMSNVVAAAAGEYNSLLTKRTGRSGQWATTTMASWERGRAVVSLTCSLPCRLSRLPTSLPQTRPTIVSR